MHTARKDNAFEKYAETRIAWFEDYLAGALRHYERTMSQRFLPLLEAMRYSLEGGGKRFRPLLILASAEALGLEVRSVLPAACAVEFLHTYSLIHDDLPALDNDDQRRGKPSSHKAFGEATAILAGDALLTESFAQLARLGSEGHFEPARILSVIELVASSSGVRGLVGGQYLDVALTDKKASLPEVEFVHVHKTGALILASVLLPVRLAAPSDADAAALKRYGEAVGLAFQLSDDLLDAVAERAKNEKAAPSYADHTTPSELKEKLRWLVESAVESVAPLGDRSVPLQQIARFLAERDR